MNVNLLLQCVRNSNIDVIRSLVILCLASPRRKVIDRVMMLDRTIREVLLRRQVGDFSRWDWLRV